jgi:beta-lactamase class A
MKRIYYIKGQPKSKRKTSPYLLILGSFAIAILFLTRAPMTNITSENVLGKQDTSLTETITPYPTISLSPTPKNINEPSALLGQTIRDALTGSNGSYGIVIKNLKTGENYSLNEHVLYYSASLYKLWIMAETYRQIENGMLKEDDMLSEKYEDLNNKFNIDPNNAAFKEGTITLSIKDALNKMITISDNYAALLLSSKVRLVNVASFLKTNGFNESTIGITGIAPATTAYDTSTFFEKLYNKKLINEQYSDKMLELLKAQKLNDKIPKYLPDGILAAHKTGELDGYTHDAGIIYTQSNDYIIVVLSKSDNPALAKNRISKISESVYNYFILNR